MRRTNANDTALTIRILAPAAVSILVTALLAAAVLVLDEQVPPPVPVQETTQHEQSSVD